MFKFQMDLLRVSRNEFFEIYDDVVIMLRNIKTAIENAAVQKGYCVSV